MDKLEGMTNVEPVRLGPESRFKFNCHPAVQCFTRCCKDINIILTPYDIIRLKNRVGLSSEEFLALYTEAQILEKTDLPVVMLKLLDAEDADSEGKACPFVRENGCLVYEDRPTTCRYYPLGVASLSHKEDSDGEEFYFFVHEPHCLGFEEDKEWTIAEFRQNQGAAEHDKINAEWTDLVVRKRSFPPNMKWFPRRQTGVWMPAPSVRWWQIIPYNSQSHMSRESYIPSTFSWNIVFTPVVSFRT